MKLKNVIFINGFLDAIHAINRVDLPINKSYSLLKFNKELIERQKIYDEKRVNILGKYFEIKDGSFDVFNEEIKNGTATDEMKEKVSNFNKEFEEFLMLEDTYNFEPIEIKSADNIGMSVQNLGILSEFGVITITE